jgi:hypothetical protein
LHWPTEASRTAARRQSDRLKVLRCAFAARLPERCSSADAPSIVMAKPGALRVNAIKQREHDHRTALEGRAGHARATRTVAGIDVPPPPHDRQVPSGRYSGPPSNIGAHANTPAPPSLDMHVPLGAAVPPRGAPTGQGYAWTVGWIGKICPSPRPSTTSWPLQYHALQVFRELLSAFSTLACAGENPRSFAALRKRSACQTWLNLLDQLTDIQSTWGFLNSNPQGSLEEEEVQPHFFYVFFHSKTLNLAALQGMRRRASTRTPKA